MIGELQMGWLIILAILSLIVVGISSIMKDGKASKNQSTALSTIDGFKPAVTYGGGTAKAGVALDPSSDQFAIIHPGALGARLFNFDQLVAVEVERNGSSIQKTNRGSQAAGVFVGAALLGPVGLLLGGLTGSKKNVEKVQKLSLKIYTNDLEKPLHEIAFLDEKVGFKPDSQIVKQAAEQLDEWYGRFRTILEMR